MLLDLSYIYEHAAPKFSVNDDMIYSDLLKEHHIRCEFRGDRPIPIAVVGRKRRACDRCSQRKISCSGQIPCERCITAGIVCEKTSPADTSQLAWQNSVNSNNSRSEVDSSVPEEEEEEESDEEDDGCSSDPPDLRGSIEYLLNGQAQGNVGFVQVFPVSTTPDEDEEGGMASTIDIDAISVLPQSASFDMDFNMGYDASILPDIDLNMLFGEMGYLMNIGLEPNSLWDPHIFSEHSSPATATDLDVYDAHASFLRPELFKIVQSFQLGEESVEYQRAVEAVELVTGDVLQRFTISFFRHWHKHGSIIHLPSYSPSTCATVLILAMSCIGGLYVKDQNEIRKCRNLLDIVEVYIYSRDYLKHEYEFCQPYGANSIPNDKRTYENVDWEDFEKLQAAYLIIVVQTWAGHRVAKRRIRQQRFTRVLELARQLKLPSAHHKIHPTNAEEFMKWIRVETAIRLQNIMLTIDCAFLMVVPSPPVRSIKVLRTLRMSFMTPWPVMPELNTLDLFVLVHVLYVLLAQDLSSQIEPSATALAAMKQGIDFWMKSWNAARHRYPENDWKALGLERTSDRYWVLVKAVFLASEKDIKEGRRVLLGPRSDIDESGSHLKEFLAKRKS
ncbi:hypothetical protein ABW20_dc0108659 [Dactylellina cionopaga]|nr:hypothetical protein ABW20_dc0108659 [Dactylellina cionopaga]